MRRVLNSFLFTLLLFMLFPRQVYASSSYVLPYPSIMPGSKLYKMYSIYEKSLEFFYFGDFGQFTYNLKQADMYLVQAKTLFDYGQYLLAFQALQESDKYLKKTSNALSLARQHQKNIEQEKEILQNAAEKHIEVLGKLEKDMPAVVRWQPEKETPAVLNLKSKLDESIRIRKL